MYTIILGNSAVAETETLKQALKLFNSYTDISSDEYVGISDGETVFCSEYGRIIKADDSYDFKGSRTHIPFDPEKNPIKPRKPY